MIGWSPNRPAWAVKISHAGLPATECSGSIVRPYPSRPRAGIFFRCRGLRRGLRHVAASAARTRGDLTPLPEFTLRALWCRRVCGSNARGLAWRSTHWGVRLESAPRRPSCRSTLSPDAVAVLRLSEIKGFRSKTPGGRLAAYRELASAGIMEPVAGSDTEYRFTEEGMQHREAILEREAERIERERYDPPDASFFGDGPATIAPPLGWRARAD